MNIITVDYQGRINHSKSHKIYQETNSWFQSSNREIDITK